jgi:hypothetical protein
VALPANTVNEHFTGTRAVGIRSQRRELPSFLPPPFVPFLTDIRESINIFMPGPLEATSQHLRHLLSVARRQRWSPIVRPGARDRRVEGGAMVAAASSASPHSAKVARATALPSAKRWSSRRSQPSGSIHVPPREPGQGTHHLIRSPVESRGPSTPSRLRRSDRALVQKESFLSCT